MTDIVTADEVNGYLRRDLDDGDDTLVATLTAAATDSIMAYLNWTVLPTPVPSSVKGAVLRLIADMYTNRDGAVVDQVSAQYGYGYLPPSVTSLIYSLREPSTA